MPRAVLLASLIALAACETSGGGASPADDAAGSTDTIAPAEDADLPAPCAPATAAAGEVRARALAADCPEDLPTGPLVAARAGDVVLENAVARFVVRVGEEGHALAGVPGGHLVDAVLLDPDTGAQRTEDGLRELALGADFWMVRPAAVSIVDDGSGGEARVLVEGELVGFPLLQDVFPLPQPAVLVTHELVLAPDAAALDITTRFEPSGDEVDPSIIPVDVAFWGGDQLPFVPGLGSEDLPVATESRVAAQTPRRADSAVAAYAIARPVIASTVNASGILASVWPSETVPPDGVSVTRRLGVGADLAAALTAADPDTPRADVGGTVAPSWPGQEVEALDDAGGPLARCSVDVEGAWSCALPVETAELRVVWRGDGAGGPSGPQQIAAGPTTPVTLTDGGTWDLTPEAPATVALTVTNGDAAPIPFRFTAWRADGEELTAVDGDGDGAASFLLPPGDYQLWLHHGPHHDQHHAEVTLTSGTTLDLAVSLSRVVDASGWASCDLHVHAESSTDSDTAHARRLAGARAEGLDYVVATDHDFVTDPATWAPADGAGPLVEAGVEASTNDWGHFNVWPLPVLHDVAGQGAPHWFGLDLLDVFALLRGGDPERLVQCNHPRFQSASLFGSISFDAATVDLALVEGCDLLELVNGIGHGDTPQVLDDWTGLLDRGLRITATGVSDCHGTDDFIGSPRTLARVDPPLTHAAIRDALRAGRAIATGGPLLTVALADGDGKVAGIGETLASPAGPVTAEVRLDAPDWMALGTLTVRATGGAVLLDEDVSTADRPIVHTVDVPTGDGWVVAVHTPGAPSKPGIHRPAWAITNPAFVDADGDGDWAP